MELLLVPSLTSTVVRAGVCLIGLSHPDLVLADIDARRRILALHEPVPGQVVLQCRVCQVNDDPED